MYFQKLRFYVNFRFFLDFPMIFKAFPTKKGAMRAENPLKIIAKSRKIEIFAQHRRFRKYIGWKMI